MKIIVRAKTNSKKESVERVTQPTLGLEVSNEPDVYKVSVKEPPIDGKANKAIIKKVAEYFNIAPSCVNITSGLTSKTKTIEIHI